MSNFNEFASKIKTQRAKRSLTIRQLAKETNVSPAYISMLENGKIKGMQNKDKSKKVASYLGVNLGDSSDPHWSNKDSSMRGLVSSANVLLNKFGINNFRRGLNNSTYTDIDEALDYPVEITYYDYLHRYKRQDLAHRVIKAPVAATWRYEPDIYESTEEDTKFEKDFDELKNKLNLFYYLYKVDLIANIGRYGVLFLGFDDAEDVSKEVKRANNLLYVSPIVEPKANILTWDKDIKSPRYGLPELYQINLSAGSNQISTKIVHWSRLIHLAENSLDNEIYGLPRLEAVYNRLIGLEKLAGGSPEMYWRGARPGYTAQAIDNGIVNETQLNELKEQLSDFVNNLQRWLYVEGLNIQSLSPQVVSPKDHVDVQLQLISAASRIPIRILIGSERGELSSNQDERAWLSYIDERREEVGERSLLRPLIDRLISVNVLSTPKDGYHVEWPAAVVLSEKDKAEIGKIHTEALSMYVNSIGASDLVPPEVFLKRELGMSDAEIELATNIIEEEITKEDEGR